MNRALLIGELVAAPQERTAKNGRPFATARASIPQGDDGRVFCSVIAFDDDAVTRLLQLKTGASVALAGRLKVSVWTDKNGTARPSLDLVADEVASTTPRPRKRDSGPENHVGGDSFDDLPGAGDMDWRV